MAIADCAATRLLLLQAARALRCVGRVTPVAPRGSIEQFSSGMRASQPNRRCIALLLVVGGASAAQEQAMHQHGNAM